MLDVEDGACADGAKVAHEECFFPVDADIWHELVRDEDGGDAPQDDHEDAEAEQAADGDARELRGVELAPGHDGANVHEAAKVEQHVHDGVDLVVALLCLPEEVAIPVETVTGDEAGKEIVGTNQAADTQKP